MWFSGIPKSPALSANGLDSRNVIVLGIQEVSINLPKAMYGPSFHSFIDMTCVILKRKQLHKLFGLNE